MTCCVNGILHCVLEFADIASLCPEEAVLFSNTLTLQLQDIFANIHKPEVIKFYSILFNNNYFGHILDLIIIIIIIIESNGSAIPLPSVLDRFSGGDSW